MKQKSLFRILPLFLLFLLPMITLSSCDDEEDEPEAGSATDNELNDPAYYDFSIVWSVIDRGDYTTAEAQTIAAEFTNLSENQFKGMKTKDAVKYFNDFCEQLRYQLGTGYKKITLKANLVREQGNRVIATKTFYIRPEGSSIQSINSTGTTHSIVTISD